MSTKEKLTRALTDANAPDWLLRNAQNGMYGDFESNEVNPIMTLVQDCRCAGLEPIAQGAINGDFDATSEEAEAWYDRDGKDILNRLGR